MPRRALTGYVAVALLEAALAPLLVRGLKGAVDSVVAGTPSGLPMAAPLVLAGATLGTRVIADVRGALATSVGLTAVDEASALLLAHATTLSGAEVDDPDTQNLLSRGASGVSSSGGSVVFAVGSIIASAGTLVGTLGALATVSPLVAALCGASVLPTFFVQRTVNNALYQHRASTSVDARKKDYVAGLLTAPSPLVEAQLNGYAGVLLSTWRAQSQTLLRGWRARYLRNAILGIAAGLAASSVVAVAYWVVMREGGGAGDVAAAFAALGLLVSSLGFLTQAWSMLHRHAMPLGDWLQFLQTKPRVSDPPVVVSCRRHEGLDLAFDDVSFSYGHGPFALSGVTFRIAPGELLAVVGRNGAGKTTLVRLIGRLYDPERGAVRIGGVDLREMPLAGVRSSLGVLVQDFARLQFTVREALAIGSTTAASDDVLWDALGSVGLEATVDTMGGLDSRLGRLFPGGRELSGGEWQRLALARLFVQQPAIWILDEPTASLDPRGEMEIFGVLREHLAGHVGVIVSHRFATVRSADRILVLDDGRVVEYGSHEQLLDDAGLYATMFEEQAKAFR